MPNCISPGHEEVVKTKQGSTATAQMHHCDNRYVYLVVSFAPQNIGARIKVQGFFKCVGEKGSKPVTRKVEFRDDGTVIGYGNSADGVRFPQPPFMTRHPHEAYLDVHYV